MSEQEEKRRYPRIPLELVTDLQSIPIQLSKDVLPATIRDISDGGVFIETTRTVAPGRLIMLKLKLPSEDSARSIMGLVRWCRAAAPRGLGIQFMTLQPASIPAVKKYLESVSQYAEPEQ